MADISANFLGIKSPNPFWLASAPPTDKKINVLRAFEAGWGGVVWKTLGSQVKNVSSRYSAVNYNGSRVMGFNNIELDLRSSVGYKPPRDRRMHPSFSRPGHDRFIDGR
jgi:dihydropyrimidine dehydrogenase (NAD+) subunit PreA